MFLANCLSGPLFKATDFPPRLLGVVPMTAPQSATEEDFLAGFLGLPSRADVLRVNLPLVAGQAFSPAYALLLHRPSRSVVVSFRGTTRVQGGHSTDFFLARV